MTSRSFQADFIERIGDFRQILDTLELLPGAMFAIKNLACCEPSLVAAKASPARSSRDNVARRSAAVFMVLGFGEER